MAILSSATANAQVIFSEDFDGVGGPTVGGAGTYTFPAGWYLCNVDNRTPNAQVAYVNEAWERREDFSFNTTDSAAFSTSYYSPAGAADDWMWTPLIGPLPANALLKWNAVTYDANYRDGYEVRIMNGTANPGGPTGTPGNLGNMVTNSTQLFSIAAEASVWTSHTVDLGPYAGFSVRIAFRNTSNDKFLLLIDDVVVETPHDYDAQITSAGLPTQYTQIPLQQVTSFPLKANIQNKGLLSLTNVRLKAEVFDVTHTLVFSDTSAAIPTLLKDTLKTFDAGNFIPAISGSYTFEFTALMDQTDQVLTNDMATASVIVTDTVYARDNGIAVGSIGIGAGTTGYVGQMFEIINPTALRSVTFAVTLGYTGRPAAVAVWNTTAGVPASIIASTDTLLYPDDSARVYTLGMHDGEVLLAPGKYVFTMIEFDSTLALANTTDVFTTGTVWVYWAAIPGGTWRNVETFGAGFAKSLILRPNLYTCPVITNSFTTTDPSCLICPDGTATATPNGGVSPYTYSWSNGDSGQTADSLLPGTYNVVISDAFNCIKTDTVTVGATVGMEEKEQGVNILPNPSNGQFSLILDNYSDRNGRIEIFNIVGEQVYNSPVSGTGNIQQSIDLSKMPAGTYTLRLISEEGTILKRLIIQ